MSPPDAAATGVACTSTMYVLYIWLFKYKNILVAAVTDVTDDE